MRVVLEITAMQIDGVGNVLDEAPIKLANCVLLFCKGLGWLTSVNLPGIETRRQSQDGQVGPTCLGWCTYLRDSTYVLYFKCL